MTDRGLPSVDGAPACPFVAFEDDRDERATSPDHRHRCYAEVRPAPRALAHQEAYCLSSAFPACPTFQDWARREAARARQVAPPAEPESSQRNPPREWSAPPPWLTDDVAEPPPSAPPDFLASRDQPGAGLAGSAADRLAGEQAPPEGRPSAGPPPAAGHPLDAAAAASTTAAVPPAAAQGAPPGGAAGDAWLAEDGAANRDDDDYGQPPAGHSPRSRGGLFGDRRPRVGQTRPREMTTDLSGPAWERPRRYEAYPTLRRRIGMPRIPPLAIAAVALVVAAIALFFLPQLLGVGQREPDSGTVPSASPSASASTATPTTTPAPTPQVYVVATGDTLSLIAQEHGVSIEELLAANPNITNPDQIAIGDEIIIPVPDVPLPSQLQGSAAPAEESPEPSPGG